MIDDDDEVVPFDATCPHCHGPSDVGACFDGSEYDCGNCGRHVVATLYRDSFGQLSYSLDKPSYGNEPTRQERRRAIRSRRRSAKQRRGWA
jgi:hypothetical protein